MFKVFITTCLAVLIPCFMLFNCQLPQPPAGPEEVQIDVVLQTSDEKTTGIVITDTVGNQIQIRSIFTLTHYIDSAKIEIFSESTLEKTIQCRYKTAQVDTIFIPYTFTTSGTRTIKMTGYIKEYTDIVSTVTIHVLDRPTTNKKPALIVPGNQTIRAGQLLTFTVAATDSNAEQQITINTLKKPAGSTFIKDTFSWTPELADIGTDTIIFIATDNVLPALSDTETVFVTISLNSTPDTIPPVIKFQSPSKDTVISADSFEIKVTCVDGSGCAVKGFRDGTAFSLKQSVSVANLWTGTAKGIAAGSSSTIKIVATDSSTVKNKDSASVKIKYDNDVSGPSIALVTPAKDSVTINSSNYTVVLKVTDPSGVLSMNGVAGETTYTGVRDTGSTWKINVSTLESNKATVIVLTATDSSLKANKSLDTIYIRSVIVNGYKIKFDKNDSAATGSMVDQTINSGDSAKLSANAFAKEGSIFGGWMTSPAGSTIAYADCAMFKMGTSAVTLYAKWIKKTTFALTITATNGAVTKSPNTAVYDSGTVVTLTAVPDDNYHFTSWSGVLTGSANPAAITMNGEKSVTAGFVANPLNTFTLTVSASNGTVKKTPDLSQYDSGTVVTLTAVPAVGYQFTGWGGNLSNGTNPELITMNGAKSVIANFSIKTYSLSITAMNGSVAKSPNAPLYDSGTVVTLTAVPVAGYQFTGWSGGLSGSTNPATITMDGVKSVAANFVVKTYALLIIATNGSVAKSPNAAWYDSGTVVTLTATPSTGYQFTGWSGGMTVSTNPVSITMNGEKSVTANFVIKTYALSISATNGTVTKSPNAALYDSGTVVTLTATSASGFQFTGWSGGLSGTTSPAYIVMNGIKSVTANFAQLLTVDFNSQGGSTVSSQTVLYSGHATTPSAPTRSCYQFVGWYKEASCVNSWDFSNDIVTSTPTTLFAKWVAANVTVTNPPTVVYFCPGANGSISVSAPCATTFEWHHVNHNNVPPTDNVITVDDEMWGYSGESTNELHFTGWSGSMHGGWFYCKVSNGTSSANSGECYVTVQTSGCP